MASFRFTPFDKPLAEVDASDLCVLRAVSEGWYVEYKSDLIKPRDIAKSLSAFANQYGGWLFFGVSEADDATRTASSFPGIPCAQIPVLEENLRNASRDLVNPHVVYDHSIINGPIGEIGLKDDRAIVIVVVPPGPDTPYVHADGRIYRRVADSSSPRPETDRAALDLLWRRGSEARAILAEMVTKTPIISQREKESAYLHLFMTSDPFGHSGHWYAEDFESFYALMSGNPLPFDNVFTSAGGFIARQVAGNETAPQLRLFTWEFERSCHSFVTLPINSSSNELASWLTGYSHALPFLQRIASPGFAGCRVLDLNILFESLTGIVGRHRALAARAGVSGPFFVKAHIENVWRCVPYLDVPAFAQALDRFGVPIIQEDDILAPPGTELATFIVLPELTTETFVEGHPRLEDRYSDAVTVAVPLFTALGVVQPVLAAGSQDLLNLWERAREVQRIRGDGAR